MTKIKAIIVALLLFAGHNAFSAGKPMPVAYVSTLVGTLSKH